MRRFFKDDMFDFQFRIVLGSTSHHCADPGEAMATHARIKDGKPDSWLDEWEATASGVEEIAAKAASAGNRQSAWCAYMRAANYYDAATYSADKSSDASRFLPIWERHRDCWDKAVDLAPHPVERLEISYEDTTLPAYFFKIDDSGEPRPLFIFNNGSDGAMTAFWNQGGAAALERGYNALAFDGPGQQAALFRQNLYFRPDWEAVITPVVDHMIDRDDVDSERIGLLGVSQAGYWVPRAVAFEKRIAAAVADPGVFDVGATWTAQMPDRLLKLVESGDRDKFDRDMGIGLKLMKGLRGQLEFRMRPYGMESLFDVLVAVREYTLEGVAEKIECPMLIANPENEDFWPGQSQQLYAALTCEKTLVKFTATEGADGHCEPLATYLREQRIFDWFDEKLSPGR